MKHSIFINLFALSLWMGAPVRAEEVGAPAPIGPLPTAEQVEWQKMETYAFIHFGPNTFAGDEWGYGDVALEKFNPTKLDADQWARTLKAAGMTGVILTAKHHDGFCLWPTRYTDYSVRNTPFLDGKGDIVGLLSAAAKKHGLKFGLYLSPWDRHQAFYGTPLYVDYYHAQLEELLSSYGPLFEFWLDGANGGDGWYGGARTTYKINPQEYYNYPAIHQHIFKHWPKAIIFSDGGPGCRWVGNEKGFAGETCWSFVRSADVYPGYEHYETLTEGHADGDAWMAAECDVSIRPGWFWHEKENEQVKTLDQLMDIYYRSVGHNATMLLNVPVDADGLIHPIDSLRLMEFRKQVDTDFAHDLCPSAKISVSDERGKAFSAAHLTDGDYDSYWATADGKTTGSITMEWKKPQRVSRLLLQEYIPLGQRVEAFTIEYKDGKQWRPLDAGEATTTIGYKRLLRFPTITTKALRIHITKARGPLCINRVGIF